MSHAAVEVEPPRRPLDAGWLMMAGASLGSRVAPVPVDLVLLHQRVGVALIEFSPAVEDLASLFRKRLAQGCFAERHPGVLPVVRASLPGADLGALPALLREAFAAAPPIGLAGKNWIADLQTLLREPPPELRPVPSAVLPEITPRGRRGGRVMLLGALAVFAMAGAAVLLGGRLPALQAGLTHLADGTAVVPAQPQATPGAVPDTPREDTVAAAPAQPPAAAPVAPAAPAEPDPPRSVVLAPPVVLPAEPDATAGAAVPIETPGAEAERPPPLPALTVPAAPPPYPVSLPSPAPATPALQHTPPPPAALPAPPAVAAAAPVIAALAGPPAPPRQAAPAPRRIEAEQLAALMRRGEALLAVGDVSAARRFFERAAEAGSAPAALALARTYDAGELARLGARGIAPDTAAADRWQARARQLEEQTP